MSNFLSDDTAPSRRPLNAMGLPLQHLECEDEMVASFFMDETSIEFDGVDGHRVRIDRAGLTLDVGGADELTFPRKDVKVLGDLGRGACSVVRKVIDVETRELFAVKVFSAYEKEKRMQLLQEVYMLARVSCSSLIGFFGAFLEGQAIHVMIEYMNMGSLYDVIHNWTSTHYDEYIMGSITYQLLWGLAYLHFERRLHRDIKPQNILLNSLGEVKLGDFGIAKTMNPEEDMTSTTTGTSRYMSPERLAGEPYGAPGDIWSLGVVLLELATRTLPFASVACQIDLFDLLKETKLEEILQAVPEEFSDTFLDVIRACLQYDPKDRLTAGELLQMPFFQGFGLDDAVDTLQAWLKTTGRIDEVGDNDANLEAIALASGDVTEACVPRAGGMGRSGPLSSSGAIGLGSLMENTQTRRPSGGANIMINTMTGVDSNFSSGDEGSVDGGDNVMSDGAGGDDESGDEGAASEDEREKIRAAKEARLRVADSRVTPFVKPPQVKEDPFGEDADETAWQT